MAVWCRQSSAQTGVVQAYVIEPHAPDQTDAELLAIKRKGAGDKGWTVTRTSRTSFTATKVRWGDISCVREFWID